MVQQTGQDPTQSHSQVEEPPGQTSMSLRQPSKLTSVQQMTKRLSSCSNSRFSVLGSAFVYEVNRSGQHFHIPVRLISKQQHKDIIAMVDSGATTKFLHRRFVERNSVTTRKLARPIPLYNIDGTENCDGTITEVAVLDMAVGDHREKVVFMVMDIGEEDVIIGLDWLCKHNPEHQQECLFLARP